MDATISVHKFATRIGNQYFFDNVSGSVIPCQDAVGDIIENYFSKSKDRMLGDLVETYKINMQEAKDNYKYVDTLIKYGFFYKNNGNDPGSSKKIMDEHALLHPTSSILILVVTEDCNLRCKYCVYSDCYPEVKSYSSKRMNFETAKKAIDYYMYLHRRRQQAGFKKSPMIGFYGGEPLLEFKLIEQVIEHCNANGFEPDYYLTTNGTVMNRQIIDFIIDHPEITLTVSLDGDKNEHDRKRVFSNNQGTFDQIMRNLAELQKEKKRRGIEQLINFNCCYDSFTDMCRVVDFFEKKKDLFSPYYVMFGEINRFDTNYYDYLNKLHARGLLEGHNRKLSETFTKLRNEFHSDLEKGIKTSTALNALLVILLFCLNRTKGSMPILNNACIPTSKIAVDPDGEFYLCERINQQHSIGNVHTKIDFEKTNLLVSAFLDVRAENCANCNISRLCEVCYVHFSKNDRIEFNDQFCSERRKSITHILSSLYSILEVNPNAFDGLTDLNVFKTHEMAK